MKHLPYKYDNLSSNPQNPCKSQAAAWACNPSALMMRWKSQKLMGQLACFMQWWTIKIHDLNKVGGEDWYSRLSFDLHTYVAECACERKHTHKNWNNMAMGQSPFPKKERKWGSSRVLWVIMGFYLHSKIDFYWVSILSVSPTQSLKTASDNV